MANDETTPFPGTSEPGNSGYSPDYPTTPTARPARRGSDPDDPTSVLGADNTQAFGTDNTQVFGNDNTQVFDPDATTVMGADDDPAGGGIPPIGGGSGSTGSGDSGMPKKQKMIIGIIAGVVALALIITVIVIATRGKKEEPPAPVVTTTTTASPSPTPTPEPTPEPVWPLTGMTGVSAENRPAVAVKIENAPEARPQSGLEHADLVYEEMVEGGISRFIAVYQSNYPTAVYPVRSVRPMDGPLIAPLKGLLAYSGGQRPFITTAQNLGLQTLSEDQGSVGFSRMKSRRAPHNVSGNVEAWAAAADANHAASPAQQFQFATAKVPATAPTSGTAASHLAVVISQMAKPNWAYDAGTGLWYRSEGNKAAVNADGNQLSAMNVIALKMKIQTLGNVDAAGTHVPETLTVGSGEGIVATGGAVVNVTWSRSSEYDPIKLTTATGEEVVLAPGNTWLELVPADSGSYTAS